MIKETQKWNNWKIGKVEVNGKVYKYGIKHFDEPSKYGIKQGRISKLFLENSDGKLVVNYDRGWDIKPKKDENNAIWLIMKKYDPEVYKKAYSVSHQQTRKSSSVKLPTQAMLNKGLGRLRKMF